MIQVPLSEMENAFVAISYMWGPEEPSKHLFIDGMKLQVRENIWLCLKHLRDVLGITSKIWVDSLCINQNHLEEKSHQVAMMEKIFKMASKVLVWLGSTSTQNYLDMRVNIVDLPTDAKYDDLWTDKLGHSDARSWAYVNQIMSIIYNPYWYRLWIIQEVALAQKVCIIFGEHLLEKDCLLRAYFAARENSKPGYRWRIARQTDPLFNEVGTGLLDYHPLLDAFFAKDEMQRSYKNLITKFRWQYCSNPRDYVYGLLGLLPSASRNMLQIDYNISNEHLAIQVLNLIREETLQEEDGDNLGFDLQAAADIVTLLNVSSSSYVNMFQSSTPSQSLELLEFDISLRPFIVLTRCNRPHSGCESSIQLPVSGHLTKTLTRIEPADRTSVKIKLLDGHIRNLCYGPESQPQHSTVCENEDNGASLIWCWVHLQPLLILRQCSGCDGEIEIEHFVTTSGSADPDAPLIEKKIDSNLRKALEGELNAAGHVWRMSVVESLLRGHIRLSLKNLISLCEVVARPKSSLAEFWNSSQ